VAELGLEAELVGRPQQGFAVRHFAGSQAELVAQAGWICGNMVQACNETQGRQRIWNSPGGRGIYGRRIDTFGHARGDSSTHLPASQIVYLLSADNIQKRILCNHPLDQGAITVTQITFY
jgi:hypothetical protein